jgi:hypothetical protein
LLVVPIVIALAVAGLSLLRRRAGSNEQVGSRVGVWLVATWAIVPPALLLLASWTSGTNIFQARYATSAAPGLALLVGVVLRMIDPALGRRLAAVALVVVSVWTFGLQTDHWVEPWSRVASTVNRAVDDPAFPVLVRTGFVEATQPSWLVAGERRDYLAAPLDYYRFEGRITLLPYRIDRRSTPYLERVASSLTSHPRFLVVANYQDPFNAWFRERLGPEGFRVEWARRYGVIWLTMFERA